MIDAQKLIADIEESQSYVQQMLDNLQSDIQEEIENPQDVLNQINSTLEEVRTALRQI